MLPPCQPCVFAWLARWQLNSYIYYVLSEFIDFSTYWPSRSVWENFDQDRKYRLTLRSVRNQGQDSPIQTDLARLILKMFIIWQKQEQSWICLVKIKLSITPHVKTNKLINPLTPMPAVTVITFDQTWPHLCSTSAGGEDLSSDAQIRVIGRMEPEICTKMLKKWNEKLRPKFATTTPGCSMVKVARLDDAFLEVF